MDKCPRCGSTRVYPSRHRGAVERLHQALTDKRPYRCHKCGWREWTEIAVTIPHQPDIDPYALKRPRPERPLSGDELDQLDPPQVIDDPRRAGHSGPVTTDELDDLDPEK